MATKSEILDAALDILRDGGRLTIDAVAHAAQLTKPGVVHHFATKEALAIAVLDHLFEKWEVELHDLVADDATASDKLRAYVEYALLSDIDSADLALLADPRLRDKLTTRWAERMEPWIGGSDDPRIVAARLIADGAWIDRGLGILELSKERRAAVVKVALKLVDEGKNRP